MRAQCSKACSHWAHAGMQSYGIMLNSSFAEISSDILQPKGVCWTRDDLK